MSCVTLILKASPGKVLYEMASDFAIAFLFFSL